MTIARGTYVLLLVQILLWQVVAILLDATHGHDTALVFASFSAGVTVFSIADAMNRWRKARRFAGFGSVAPTDAAKRRHELGL